MTNLPQDYQLSLINTQLSRLTMPEQLPSEQGTSNGFSIKVTVPRNLTPFNLEEFVNNLSVQERLKMIEVFQDGMSETQAVLALIETLSQNTIVSKNTEEKQSVTEIINLIVDAIMLYNRQNYKGDAKVIVIPSYGVINKVSDFKFGKQVAPTTTKAYFEEHQDELTEELVEMGIKEGMEDKNHNGRYHRTTMDKIICAISEYID